MGAQSVEQAAVKLRALHGAEVRGVVDQRVERIRTVTGTGLPVTAGSSQGLSVLSEGGGFPTSCSCSISR